MSTVVAIQLNLASQPMNSVVSKHRLVYLKITLTCSFTRQTDYCTSWRMASKVLINAKSARPFPGIAQAFSALVVQKKTLPERAGSYLNTAMFTVDYATTHVGTLTICLCLMSPLYFLSTLYVTHTINYSRPSPVFPYCKQWKAGQGLGTRLGFD